jgi:hypothetical protein
MSPSHVLYQTAHENADEAAHEHATIWTESRDCEDDFLRQDVEGQGKAKEQRGDRSSLKAGCAWRRHGLFAELTSAGGKMDLRIEGLTRVSGEGGEMPLAQNNGQFQQQHLVL